jgi:hypothetical protein
VSIRTHLTEKYIDLRLRHGNCHDIDYPALHLREPGTDSVAFSLADIVFGWLRSTTKAIGLLAGVLGVLSLPAYAQTSWTGATSTDWFTGTNWNTGVVPTAADLVILNTITPNPTFVSGGAAVANILFVAQTGTGALTSLTGQ